MGTHSTVGSLLVTLLLFAFLFMHCSQFSSATTFLASSNMSSCFKSERDALLDLKHSLVDETNRLSSWIGDDCCRWYGIRCSGGTGHVVKLDLSNPFDDQEYDSSADYYKNLERYALRGDRLNNSLQNLKHLTHLDLSFNNFSYIQIPDVIGSLVNMRYLNLSGSCFAGKNPHHLGNLSALRYLDLSGLNIDIDNLWWLSQLYYLKHLDLSSIDLSKATNWFPAINLLPSLSVLHLSDCSLDYSIIPAHSNINFTSLLQLDLSDNIYYQTNVTTTNIPHWITNIIGLVKLNLAWNMLEGPIPSEMGNLTQLRYLNLRGNQFTGNIPPSFEKLAFLESLNIRYNQLSGNIPAFIGQLIKLQVLDLSGNRMSGVITEDHFQNLTSLIHLDLSRNSGLRINFNPTWMTPFQLVYLALSSTKVGPSFPPWIRHQKYLEILYLYNANIVDNISENHFYNLTGLEELDLSFNPGLSMNFTPTWTPPFQLVYLDLSSTKVGPSFLPWIRHQKYLERLHLYSANIVDNISENHFFYNLTSLKFLGLSLNPGLSLNFTPTWTPPFQLTGLSLSSTKVGPRFPLWIRNQRNLDTLDLSNAGIADNIPHWFSSLLTNLETLDVSNNLLFGLVVANATTNNLGSLSASNNLLSGVFPTWLCNMKSIYDIDLSNNQLSGTLPPCLGSLRNLQRLILENNSFWGSIPTFLGFLPLNSLHLRNNRFEGQLPSSFQNLTGLVTLDLGENNLTGVIPSWIGQTLCNLKVLLLPSNRFNGPIPQQLCQLPNLQTINLASNNISGSIPSCFSNLTAMVRNLNNGSYYEIIWESRDGVEREYKAAYFISIDLSNNSISGVIPKELMELLALVKLNVSGNHIEGRIPNQIGNLRNLLSLDLSRNKLSGSIPQSLSNLYSLEYLNLSFNDLSGKIPTGFQLQTLNDSANYMGNVQLCGPPLNQCEWERNSPDHSRAKEPDDDDDVNVKVWFYSGMGPGILAGFLGFCGALHFNKRWRYAYFRFIENVYDILEVAIAVKAARLRRKFQKHKTEGDGTRGS